MAKTRFIDKYYVQRAEEYIMEILDDIWDIDLAGEHPEVSRKSIDKINKFYKWLWDKNYNLFYWKYSDEYGKRHITQEQFDNRWFAAIYNIPMEFEILAGHSGFSFNAPMNYSNIKKAALYKPEKWTVKEFENDVLSDYYESVATYSAGGGGYEYDFDDFVEQFFNVAGEKYGN